MMKISATAKTIDEYVAGFPIETQQLLQVMRQTIREAAPDAQEAIKYAMPCYVLNGNLVYFAGYKKHIGFYATPTGHNAFRQELSGYKQGKGSVQFPLTEPLPVNLISRIVAFRVQQNQKKAKTIK